MLFLTFLLFKDIYLFQALLKLSFTLASPTLEHQLYPEWNGPVNLPLHDDPLESMLYDPNFYPIHHENIGLSHSISSMNEINEKRKQTMGNIDEQQQSLSKKPKVKLTTSQKELYNHRKRERRNENNAKMTLAYRNKLEKVKKRRKELVENMTSEERKKFRAITAERNRKSRAKMKEKFNQPGKEKELEKLRERQRQHSKIRYYKEKEMIDSGTATKSLLESKERKKIKMKQYRENRKLQAREKVFS